MRLQGLSSLHLDELYADLRAAGSRKTGADLSPRTVRYVHTILQKELAQLLTIEHEVVFQPHPKSDHGRRTIDLGPEINRRLGHANPGFAARYGPPGAEGGQRGCGGCGCAG
ncbi:MAG TPA: hypothetical protein VHE80_03235 [Acidimicrobiales bacterium]|nr:hypothetical protein [Acidimicrobiales bacterium]